MFGCNRAIQHARELHAGRDQIETAISQLYGKASKLWLLTSRGYDSLPPGKSRRIHSIGLVLRAKRDEAENPHASMNKRHKTSRENRFVARTARAQIREAQCLKLALLRSDQQLTAESDVGCIADGI